jgi:hypothetical protein
VASRALEEGMRSQATVRDNRGARLAEIMRLLKHWRREGPWDLCAVNFGTSNREPHLQGHLWRMQFQIVGSRLWGGGTKGVAFQSMVSMTPAIWNKRVARDFAHAAWRAHLGEILSARGYRGHWDKTPWGRYGVFLKDLRDATAVRKEVAVLSEVASWSPSEQAGPRTTKGG